MAQLILLGPQRHNPTISPCVTKLAMKPPLALVNAGWQEREPETGELEEHVGMEIINLNLHQRCEKIFKKDAKFAQAHRAHQNQLKQIQELYRLRLDYAMRAVEKLIARTTTPKSLLDPQIAEAIEAVRTLDAAHFNRLRENDETFWREGGFQNRPVVAKQCTEVGDLLARCGGLLIAGGHVAVLLNRLRLLDLGRHLANQPVIAWSAGAMVLSERIVVFHDQPPQGRGYAEVLQVGFGLAPRIIPLPHASTRLLLGNRNRVSTFARRFRDMGCITLDAESRLDWNEEQYTSSPATFRLASDGSLKGMEEPWD